MTAMIVMIVVFLTSRVVGQVVRLNSARTSRRNLLARAKKPSRGRSASPRSRRAGRPSCPSPYRAMRGAAPDAVAVSGKSSGSSRSSVICSSSLFDTRLYFLPRTPFERTGVPGLEPGLSVLETDVLTTDTIPLRERMNAECGMMNAKRVLGVRCWVLGCLPQHLTPSAQNLLSIHHSSFRVHHFVSLCPVWRRQRRQNFLNSRRSGV